MASTKPEPGSAPPYRLASTGERDRVKTRHPMAGGTGRGTGRRAIADDAGLV